MPLNSGASRKKGGINRAQQSRGTSKKSTASRKRASRKATLPKTRKMPSKKSKSFERVKVSRANSAMSITELQFIAKSRGLPFGGLTKTKLIRKINNYY